MTNQSQEKIAVYPGTFDPITNGHLDILHRAERLFDQIIIAVAPNTSKSPLFSVDERIELIRRSLNTDTKIIVKSFEGLVVDFAKAEGAVALIRGLRAVSDFEFEFQMTQMNRDLDSTVETIFLMPGDRYYFTSSTLMKQVSYYDAKRIEKFVPQVVAEALNEKFGKKKS